MQAIRNFSPCPAIRSQDKGSESITWRNPSVVVVSTNTPRPPVPQVGRFLECPASGAPAPQLTRYMGRTPPLLKMAAVDGVAMATDDVNATLDKRQASFRGFEPAPSALHSIGHHTHVRPAVKEKVHCEGRAVVVGGGGVSAAAGRGRGGEVADHRVWNLG
ncbi:hypothetical protein Btru_069619 [Bulinus truncatus]|nr:hypothetical protein Btru_069619 [Bulinus truncatus]